MNGQSKPISLRLIVGDRGQGKTQALIARFFELNQAVGANQMMVLAGKRWEHLHRFRLRLYQQLETPITQLQIRSLNSLIREGLDLFYSDYFSASPLLIGSTESMALLRVFHQENQAHFFNGAHLSRHLYQKLWGRYRQIHCHDLSWPEIEQRTKALETAPLASDANRFLEAYQAWLKQAHILDYVGQQQVFAQLLTKVPVRQYFSQRSHWLIDDIEDYSYFEQGLLDSLLADKHVTMTGNPQGGVLRHLGAYPPFLEQVRQRPETEVLELNEKQQVMWPLGSKVCQLLQEQEPAAEQLELAPSIDIRGDATEMLEAMVRQIKALLVEGVAPNQILLTTWLLNEQLTLQLETMLEKMGCTLTVYRGAQVIQRNPLVNTLLALMRLVAWHDLKEDARIPRLSGYEMSQIFIFCGEMHPFQAAQLRTRFKNNLQAWGDYLKSRTDTVAMQRLQETVTTFREQLFGDDIPDLYTLAQKLWETLLLPSSRLQATHETQSISNFFYTLQQFTLLHQRLEPLNFSREFIFHMLNEEVFEYPLEVELPQNSVTLMTLHRLCEMGLETDYQIWFDLKSSFWQRSDYHAIDNRLLISREWPEDIPWTLDADEVHMDKKLGRMFYKGIQYCQKEAFFFACQYNLLGQRQRFERLASVLSYTKQPVPTK